MLIELRLKNLAVIESVTVPFRPGLNAVTGETGAGKSIVVDALLLVMGSRAQPDLIRTGAESALIEAVFELPPGSPAVAALEDAGHAAPDGVLVVKREISRAGRHRVFVNDSPATVGLLERLGAVRCHQHVESLTRQRVADQLGDVTFVLGDQHPGRGTPDGGVIRPSRRHFAGVACHPHPRESVAPWCCGQMTAG